MDPLEVVMRGGIGGLVVIIGLFLLVPVTLDIAGFPTYIQAEEFGNVWIGFAASLAVVSRGLALMVTLLLEYLRYRARIRTNTY